MTRILVYCPMNPQPPRIYPATLQSLLALDWSEPFEVMLGREDMPEMPDAAGKYANLVAKYNWARVMALAGEYDYLLTVEADMIVPQMALRRMTAVDADVVYGLYVSRRAGRRRIGSSRWLIFSEVSGKEQGFSNRKMAETVDERRAM